MTSILFLNEVIQDSQFRSNNLRDKKHFLNLFLHFCKLDQIFNIFKKRMTLIADVFPILPTLKYVVK